MTQHLYIRPPQAKDAMAWVQVKDRSWRAAYQSMFHSAELSVREEKWPKNAERWAGTFAELDYQGWTQRDGIDYRFLVAFWDGEAVGVAAKRCSPLDPNVEEEEREEDAIGLPPAGLGLLYVVPEHWDQGIGHALLEEILGQDSAYLWTLQQNLRAADFFIRHGFSRDRREAVLVDHPAMRMVRDLARLKPA